MTDDPKVQANIAAYKAAIAAGTHTQADLDAYLQEIGPSRTASRRLRTPTIKGFRSPEAISRLNKNDMAQATDSPKDTRTQILGGLASFGRDIPGVEALQASARSGVSQWGSHPENYRQARATIRGAEEDAPAFVRVGNRLAGGTIGMLATPGSAAKSGALFGGATGLLQSDPEAGVGNRLIEGGAQALGGAALGKLSDFGSAAIRAKAPTWLGGTPTLGANDIAREQAVKASDKALFGRAKGQGAGRDASTDMVKAMAEPDIAPYVDIVRNSRTFAGADAATILLEARNLMSEQAGKAAKTIYNAGDHKAGTSLAANDLRLAKDELVAAGEQIMPSLPGAVENSAKLRANDEQFQKAADATSRLLTVSPIKAKNGGLRKKSPEAFLESTKTMSPETAKNATAGVLGRLNENIGLDIHPLKGFGVFPSAGAIMRGPRFLRPLDKASGQYLPDFFQRALLALGNAGIDQ